MSLKYMHILVSEICIITNFFLLVKNVYTISFSAGNELSCTIVLFLMSLKSAYITPSKITPLLFLLKFALMKDNIH